jgi:hypothetical protein
VKDPVARKLGADWDGNLWVGLHGAGELLRVDYKTLKMTEFTPPSKDAGVYLAEPDLKNHLIWTTLIVAGAGSSDLTVTALSHTIPWRPW